MFESGELTIVDKCISSSNVEAFIHDESPSNLIKKFEIVVNNKFPLKPRKFNFNFNLQTNS